MTYEDLERLLSEAYCSLNLYKALYGQLTNQQVARARAHIAKQTNADKPVLTGTCENCGDQFTARAPNKRFCSDACRIEKYTTNASNQKYALRTVVCVCGKQFDTKKATQKFCSVKCRVAAHRKSDPNMGTLICVGCGVEADRTRGDQKYCGPECRVRTNLAAHAARKASRG